MQILLKGNFQLALLPMLKTLNAVSHQNGWVSHQHLHFPPGLSIHIQGSPFIISGLCIWEDIDTNTHDKTHLVCHLRQVPKGKTIKIGVWFVWRKDTKQFRNWAQFWDLQTFKPYKTSDIYLPQYCKYQYQTSCLLDWAFTSTISDWSGVEIIVSKNWICNFLTAAKP